MNLGPAKGRGETGLPLFLFFRKIQGVGRKVIFQLLDFGLKFGFLPEKVFLCEVIF